MAESTDLQRLVISLEANLKKYENEMKKAGVIADDAGGKIERRFKGVNDNLRGQTANLAAQFQDIGVQLAGGQSPLQIALQQGTQIAQVLGEGRGGAAGAVRSLGAAFASIVSPVSLLTIGLVALGGAVLQYVAGTEKVPDIDDHLKAHADLIRQIKDAYGEAAAGLENYRERSSAVLETQIRANMQALRMELEATAASVVSSASQITPSLASIEMGITEGVTPSEITAKYGAFTDALRQLAESAAQGEPNIIAFRNAVAEIARANPANAVIQQLANELLALTDNAAKSQSAMQASANAIQMMGNAASGQIGQIKELSAAMRELSSIALPQLDSRAKAAAAFKKGISGVTDADTAAALQSEYEGAIRRIEQEEAAAAAKAAARAGGGGGGGRSRAAAVGPSKESMQELRDATREAKAEIADLNRISQQAGMALSDGFQDVILRGEELDDVLKKLLQRFASMAIDNVFKQIFAGPSGGGLSPFASMFGGLFGGARASGGPVSANRAYLVGERGPELMVPKVPGVVLPNKAEAVAGTNYAPVYNIDARYAQPGVDQQIMRAIRAYDREVAERPMRLG